ncbi:hypothetical protein Tco_0410690 [Tanacetum coccineum]
MEKDIEPKISAIIFDARSSVMASGFHETLGLGSGPARASCAFSGSDPAWPCVLIGMLTPDDTLDEFYYHLIFATFRSAASVSLQLRSGYPVVESMRSLITPNQDKTDPCSLGVVSDTGSLIVTPPTYARPYGRKAGSKLSLIARSMSASSHFSFLPFLDAGFLTLFLASRDQDHHFFFEGTDSC